MRTCANKMDKVSHPTHGIYIKDGRKVVIK